MTQVVARYPGLESFVEADSAYRDWEEVPGSLTDTALGIISAASLVGSLLGKVKKRAARFGTVSSATCLVLRRKLSKQITENGRWEAIAEQNAHIHEGDYTEWRDNLLHELRDLDSACDVDLLKELIPTIQPTQLPTNQHPFWGGQFWSRKKAKEVSLDRQVYSSLRSWETVFVNAYKSGDTTKRRMASIRLYYGLSLLNNPSITKEYTAFSREAMGLLRKIANPSSIYLNDPQWQPPDLH